LLGGFNSGANSFYLNGLAEWDTLKTVLRMATTGVSKTKMSFLDATTTVKEGNMTADLYS
jgi:hypothetical protein